MDTCLLTYSLDLNPRLGELTEYQARKTLLLCNGGVGPGTKLHPFYIRSFQYCEAPCMWKIVHVLLLTEAMPVLQEHSSNPAKKALQHLVLVLAGSTVTATDIFETLMIVTRFWISSSHSASGRSLVRVSHHTTF